MLIDEEDIVCCILYCMYNTYIQYIHKEPPSMSIKPEIRQRILDAAEQLAAEGIDRPTNEQVRERLGGGSLSHISPVMREWRESLKVSAVAVREMPNEIRTVLERVGAELWRSASQLADEEVERIRTESEQREKTANDERDEALREIERLEASITTLREHGHQDEKRIEQLTAENHNLMTENATAKQRAADALERVTDLHNQLARQNEQLETMRGEGQRQQALIDKLRDEKAETSTRLATLESELKTATRELEAANQRELRLQQTLESVNEDLSSLQQDYASLRAENASAVKRNEELQSENAALRTDLDTFKASASEARSELKTANKRIDELAHTQQELTEARTQLAIIQSREEDLRQQLADQKARQTPTTKSKGSKEDK
ncbi:DNA-binding protein [Modicisalibacter xianhensis]|nr:DNA-binding protein [Halomonas xianhensis]